MAVHQREHSDDDAECSKSYFQGLVLRRGKNFTCFVKIFNQNHLFQKSTVAC